jgi:hypothetical protein
MNRLRSPSVAVSMSLGTLLGQEAGQRDHRVHLSCPVGIGSARRSEAEDHALNDEMRPSVRWLPVFRRGSLRALTVEERRGPGQMEPLARR